MRRIRVRKKSFVQDVAEDLFRAATEVAKERAKELIREIGAVAKQNAKLEKKTKNGPIIDADFVDLPEKARPALPEARRTRSRTRTSESSSPDKEP